MKFINKNKKGIEVRIGERFNFSWMNIKPGETIDLPEETGKRYGFEKVTDLTLESKQVLPKATEGKIGKTKVETKQISVPEKVVQNDFQGKLEKINGIGKKTAKDIVKVFPTEQKLRLAISHDDEFPFRDDIEIKLRRKYGK